MLRSSEANKVALNAWQVVGRALEDQAVFAGMGSIGADATWRARDGVARSG